MQKKYYGFSQVEWKTLKLNVFKEFWREGGLVYYLDPKTIMALVPRYTDPEKALQVQSALEASWKQYNSDLDAKLFIADTLLPNDREKIREVIDNPYRAVSPLSDIFVILMLAGIGILIAFRWSTKALLILPIFILGVYFAKAIHSRL